MGTHAFIYGISLYISPKCRLNVWKISHGQLYLWLTIEHTCINKIRSCSHRQGTNVVRDQHKLPGEKEGYGYKFIQTQLTGAGGKSKTDRARRGPEK